MEKENKVSIYHINHADEVTILLGTDLDEKTAKVLYEFMTQDDQCSGLWACLVYSEEEAKEHNYPIYDTEENLLWNPNEEEDN